jgi:hypothetical protein
MAEEVAPEPAKAAKEVLEKIDSAFEELGAKAMNLQNNIIPTLRRLVTAEEQLGLRPTKKN